MYKKFSHILLISPFIHVSFQLKWPLMATAGGMTVNYVSFAHFLLYFIMFQVYELLDKLSSLHGLNNRLELYKTHTKHLLDSFEDTYTIWGTHSVERLVFDVLIIEAGRYFLQECSQVLRQV